MPSVQRGESVGGGFRPLYSSRRFPVYGSRSGALYVRRGLREKVGDRVNQLLRAELKGRTSRSQSVDRFPVFGKRGDDGSRHPPSVLFPSAENAVEVTGGKQGPHFCCFIVIQAAHLPPSDHGAAIDR